MSPLRPRPRPTHELYLQHFPSAVEVLQGTGVLHGQMDVRDGQLVGQIIDVLHALLHLGQLLLKQLRGCEKGPSVRDGVRRTQEDRWNMKHTLSDLNQENGLRRSYSPTATAQILCGNSCKPVA